MISEGCLYGLCDFLFRLVCSSCFIFEYYKKKNCFFFRYMKNTARRSKPVMMIVPFVQCFVGGFCCAIATIDGCYNWGVVAVTRSLGCWLVQWSWSRRSGYPQCFSWWRGCCGGEEDERVDEWAMRRSHGGMCGATVVGVGGDHHGLTGQGFRRIEYKIGEDEHSFLFSKHFKFSIFSYLMLKSTKIINSSFI